MSPHRRSLSPRRIPFRWCREGGIRVPGGVLSSQPRRVQRLRAQNHEDSPFGAMNRVGTRAGRAERHAGRSVRPTGVSGDAEAGHQDSPIRDQYASPIRLHDEQLAAADHCRTFVDSSVYRSSTTGSDFSPLKIGVSFHSTCSEARRNCRNPRISWAKTVCASIRASAAPMQ